MGHALAGDFRHVNLSLSLLLVQEVVNGLLPHTWSHRGHLPGDNTADNRGNAKCRALEPPKLS